MVVLRRVRLLMPSIVVWWDGGAQYKMYCQRKEHETALEEARNQQEVGALIVDVRQHAKMQVSSFVLCIPWKDHCNTPMAVDQGTATA